MKKKLSEPSLTDYNKVVAEAYHATLKVLLQLISSIEREELRYTLQREYRPFGETGLVHEVISPLFYLRLQDYCNKKAAIHYGYLPHIDQTHLTSVFARSVYSNTSKEITSIDIEDCIKHEKFVHNTDELFEYIDESRKFHTFYLIPYKKKGKSKKLLRVA
jgi:hypothetical protein